MTTETAGADVVMVTIELVLLWATVVVVAVAVGRDADTLGLTVLVAPFASALPRKFSKVFPVVGALTAKTIPWAQWPA